MDYKLRELLSSSHQMVLELYKIISEKHTWITVAELSEEMSVSTRTIQRYIHKLDDFIIEFNKNKSNPLLFESNKISGVSLKFGNKENQLLFKNFIYEKDESIQLLKYLLFSKNCTKKEYCESYFISDSSLSNNTKKINKFLSEFELTISYTGLYIKGEESQIRMLCYSVAWVLFASDTWPEMFSSIPEHRIDQDIDLLVSELHIPINYIKRRELSYLIAIAIVRYRLGYTVRCKEEWLNYFPTSTGSTLSEVFTKIMMNHHVVSNEEIHFLSINMLTRSCIYEEIPLKKELVKFIQNDTIVYNATKLFLDKFTEEIFAIPIELYDEVFIFSYRSHLYAHIYSNVDFDYNANYLLDDIVQKFPTYHTEMAAFINYLFEETGDSLFLEQDYLTQRYFMIETFIKPELLIGTPIKVQLETDLPEIYENTVKRILSDYFKYSYDLIFLNNNHLQLPDITLSTIVRSSAKNHSAYFNYPLNSGDFDTISKELAIVQSLLVKDVSS